MLLSGIDDGVAVNADKVRVINTLAQLDLSADAELNTRHQHEIELFESEELKLKFTPSWEMPLKLAGKCILIRKVPSDIERYSKRTSVAEFMQRRNSVNSGKDAKKVKQPHQVLVFKLTRINVKK